MLASNNAQAQAKAVVFHQHSRASGIEPEKAHRVSTVCHALLRVFPRFGYGIEFTMFSINTMFLVGAVGFLRVFYGFLQVSRQDPAPFSKKNSKIMKITSQKVSPSLVFAPKELRDSSTPFQLNSV